MPDYESLILQSIKDRIRSTNDSDILSLMKNLLTNQAQTDAPEELLAIKKLWQSSENSSDKKQLVIETTKRLHQYFKTKHQLDIAALQDSSNDSNDSEEIELIGILEKNPNSTYPQYGPFIRNILSNIDSSLIDNTSNNAVKIMMDLFCQYLIEIDSLSKEEQKNNLAIFPPQSSREIACIGGNGSRLQEMILLLKASKETRLFLDVHSNLMSQMIKNIGKNVSPGNEVHIAPFLLYSLGLEHKQVIEKRDPVFTAPRPEINFCDLWDALQNYGTNFREKLIKEVEEHLETREEMAKIVSLIEENEDLNSTLNDHKKSLALQEQLDDLGFKLSDFCIYDEEENFVWSVDKIAANISSLKLFPQTKEPIKLPLQEQIDALYESKNLLSNKAPSRIAALLKSQNPQELLFGFNALWVLSENFKPNGSIQAFRVVEELAFQKHSENWHDKQDQVKEILATILEKIPPNHRHKIDRLYERFFEGSNPIVSKNFSWIVKNLHCGELSFLLARGASTEDIASESRQLSFFLRNSFNPRQEMEESQIIFTNLRPDKIDILRRYKDFCKNYHNHENHEFYWQDDILLFLSNAIQKNHAGVIEILKDPDLSESIFENGQIFTMAIFGNNLPATEVILGASAQKYVNSCEVFSFSKEKITPLTQAIHAHRNKSEKLVELLCKNGADPNITCKASSYYYGVDKVAHQFLPIHLAAFHGEAEVVKVLIKYGSKLDEPITYPEVNFFEKSRTTSGNTAAHLVAENNGEDYLKIIKLLGKAGANLDLRNSKGLSPLHIAVKSRSSKMVLALIEAGANIDQKSFYLQKSPLDFALENNNYQIAKLLLKNGANRTSNHSKNPAINHLLIEHKFFENFADLLEQKIKKNFSDFDQDSHQKLHELNIKIRLKILEVFDFNSEPVKKFLGEEKENQNQQIDKLSRAIAEKLETKSGKIIDQRNNKLELGDEKLNEILNLFSSKETLEKAIENIVPTPSTKIRITRTARIIPINPQSQQNHHSS